MFSLFFLFFLSFEKVFIPSRQYLLTAQLKFSLIICDKKVIDIFFFFFFLSVDFIFKLEGLLLLLILSLTYGAVFSLINLYGKIHSTASYFQKIKFIDIKFWSGFKANSSLSQSTLPFNFATNFILVKFRLYKIMLNCYVHWVKKNKKKKQIRKPNVSNCWHWTPTKGGSRIAQHMRTEMTELTVNWRKTLSFCRL